MTVVVDVRERALADALGTEATEALDVGDVKITSSDGARTAFVELKTIADLAASVVDGRHASQRSRLLAARAATGAAIVYIVRGGPLADGPTRVANTVASLAVRYNISVLRSESVAETAHLVRTLAAQLERPPPDDAALASTYVAQGSLAQVSRKRNLMTDNNAWVAMLSCVPGVSGRIAAVIAEQAFHGAPDLVDGARSDRAQTVRRIADIQVPSKTTVLRAQSAKTKRIGPALAERVVAAVLGEPLPDFKKKKTEASSSPPV